MKPLGFFVLLCGCLMFAGCTSAPAAFDRTPTPDVLMATVAALQATNAQLATQVAGLPATIENLPTATTVPTQTPPPSPTPTVTATPTATPTRVVVRRPAATATPIWPQLLWLTVDPGEVDAGQSVTLRWSTANASRAVIQQYGADGYAYGEMTVALSGSLVLPIADRERLYHSFTLIAYNAAGDSASNSINVNIRCPYTYFFSLPPEDYRWDCPQGQTVVSSAAEQYFENGRMIWLDNEKRIYVLLNDGNLYSYADTWTAGQPDAEVGIKPPAGRYAPVRGFGKVWSADPYIRSRLGWAMAPEQGYQAQLQHSWTGCCSSASPFYLREFDQRVTRLWPGEQSGSWEFTRF